MANYIHVPDEAPAVPKIDVTLDENDYRSGALRLVKELRPNWKPSEVKMKVLTTQYIAFVFFKYIGTLTVNCIRRWYVSYMFPSSTYIIRVMRLFK